MTVTTNAKNLRQYKRRLTLIEELIISLLHALTWLGKEKICLQISSKLRHEV